MAARDDSRPEAVADILRAALTEPASLGPSDVATIAGSLDGDRDRTALALGALGAVLYARPELMDAAMVDTLAALARLEPLPEGVGRALVRLFRFFAASAAAPRAWAALGALLRDPGLADTTRDVLLPLVEDFVQWREDVVGLDGILALAESPPLARHRNFLFNYGIERFAFCTPEAFTQDRLRRLAALFGEGPRYRYLLYSLASRRDLPGDARAAIAVQIADRFPLQARANAILTGRPVRLVVVQNIILGQGDEIVRLVPLVQAMLDANPSLTVSLIARRAYLYDCPRVTAIPVDDDAAVRRALDRPFDVVIEIFQPEPENFAYRSEVHRALDAARARHRPALAITGELGPVRPSVQGVLTQFTYETVELDGRDVAAPMGLDRRDLRSNYEPCLRLLAELGLGSRSAEESPRTPSILVGTPSADADRVWRSLAGSDSTSPRPVALLNPFGGADVTKGFADQDEVLAAEIAGLVEEGYRVIVLPNGTRWGTSDAIDAVLGRLSAATRAHVRVGPDAQARDEAQRLKLRERPDLADRDRITRLFKYFAVYADLVVTVEGWMAHLAYNLGRPFRLFLAAGAFTYDWYPHGRGAAQRLVASFSPRAERAHYTSALLRPGDPPPMPHRPRKGLFELALAGLGQMGGDEASSLLERAMASRDPEVRSWAVAALGGCHARARKALLLAALDDSWPGVVQEAASALMRESVDCSRELGPRFREQLQVRLDIARGDWGAVGGLGAAALPALVSAQRSRGMVGAEQARTALRAIVSPYVHRLPPEQKPRSWRNAIARSLPPAVRRQLRGVRRALGAVRVWCRDRRHR